MSKDFDSIRDDLRELERQVLAVHARTRKMPEMRSLLTIASSIGTFAEMLPAYVCFVALLEQAYDPTAEDNGLA